MKKTILLTGATDGIGFETAKMLLADGHKVLLHGRNPQKLEKIEEILSTQFSVANIESYVADLSVMADIQKLAKEVNKKHSKLDALINNAGVYKVSNSMTIDGLEIRFAVNTIAPYLLTKELLPILNTQSRVVNVSSAAQSSVLLDAFKGNVPLSDGAAYAQSKLALIMWTNHLTKELGTEGPLLVSLNPKSLLGSKMVKEAYGIDGSDLRIGADILCRAALSNEFAHANGKYYDNDTQRFASPHPDALNARLNEEITQAMDDILASL